MGQITFLVQREGITIPKRNKTACRVDDLGLYSQTKDRVPSKTLVD